MKYTLNFIVISAIYIASSINFANSQESSSFVVFPTEDVRIDTSKIAENSQGDAWANSVRAYTSTSERAVNTWCQDISSTHPSIVVSAMTVSEAGLSNCPSANDGYSMTIEIPVKNIPSEYGDMSSIKGENLYLFVRSQDSDAFSELSEIGQELLHEPFRLQASDLFPVERAQGPQDDFFPNFCQMCDCCSKGLK